MAAVGDANKAEMLEWPRTTEDMQRQYPRSSFLTCCRCANSTMQTAGLFMAVRTSEYFKITLAPTTWASLTRVPALKPVRFRLPVIHLQRLAATASNSESRALLRPQQLLCSDGRTFSPDSA